MAAGIDESDSDWTLKEKMLLVGALLGFFGALQLFVHRGDVAYAWLKLGGLGIGIAACLSFLSRETRDVFLACLAGLFTLFALAMFGGNLASSRWLLWFAGFIGAAGICVSLAKNKFAVFLGILAIVGVRLIIGFARML